MSNKFDVNLFPAKLTGKGIDNNMQKKIPLRKAEPSLFLVLEMVLGMQLKLSFRNVYRTRSDGASLSPSRTEQYNRQAKIPYSKIHIVRCRRAFLTQRL